MLNGKKVLLKNHFASSQLQQKIIQAEIRDSKYNMEYYPANEDIKNVELGKEWLPESLTAFLQVLVPSVTK